MESNNNNQSSIVPKVVGGVVAILVCCACVAILAAGWFIYQTYQNSPIEIPTEIFPPSDSSTPQPVPTIARPPADSISSETMDILNQALVPENDPYELACRLEKKCDVSKEVPGKTYKVGDKESSGSSTATRLSITRLQPPCSTSRLTRISGHRTART